MADFHQVVQWAQQHSRRWVFTDSNAGSAYFNDYASQKDLQQIDWNAVRANNWIQCRDKKQAEFLQEQQFPWSLVEGIGVYSDIYRQQVEQMLMQASHSPTVKVKRSWYY